MNTPRKLLLIILSLGFHDIYAQFLNGDFASGTPSHIITNWTNGSAQYVAAEGTQTEWIDLTGNGFGNGNYIEQAIHTEKSKKYRISFDLGSFFGWDLWDAGVTVTMNRKTLGGRIYHDSFTYSYNPRLFWQRMQTIEFAGTGSQDTFRFTGDSKLFASYGFGSGVGVIGLDNVFLDNSSNTGAIEIDGASVNAGFKIYPNPAANSFQLLVPIANSEGASINITDISGKVVFSYSQTDIPTATLNINTDLPGGIYYVHAFSESHTFGFRKLIITK